MIFRKTLSFIAVLVLTLSMVACSKTDSEAETGTDPIVTTAAPAQTTTPATTAQPETTAPVFKEITLVDDENCTVIVKGIDPDSLFGYTLNVYLENKTDKELMFSVDQVSVNGYMCDPFWASAVSAGKKANKQISFSESDFEANGIAEVTDISFTLNVYDSKDWAADYLVEKTFTVNP